MDLKEISFNNHFLFNNKRIDLINPKTNMPYKIVAFVGENGCGKTTILNELFKYDYKALFIRQNSLYSISQNEIVSTIGGNVPFKETNFDASINNSNNINNLINIDNESINNIFSNNIVKNIIKVNNLNEIKCGGEALKLLNGNLSNIDLTNISSGEREIILKIALLLKYSKNLDMLLLDEPETSLHPLWQTNIISFILELLKNLNDSIPQLFVATHSEKILERLIKTDDTLIIKCYRKNDEVDFIKIADDELCLETVSFSELDYLIYGIATYEYHDELINRIQDLFETDNMGDLDDFITESMLYDSSLRKNWKSTSKTKTGFKEIKYKSLPLYIRNYFHHPNNHIEPSTDEIKKSIVFLRKLIETLI